MGASAIHVVAPCCRELTIEFTVVKERGRKKEPKEDEMETDALLPKQSRPPTVREIWTSASSTDRTLMVLGGTGAAVGGVASGLTYVVYGRVLDAMARGTLVGLDQILVAYGQLAVAELLGVWLQYLAWSQVGSNRKEREAGADQGEEAVGEGYVEALGEVCYLVVQAITTAVIAVRLGWDSLLAVIVVSGLTALLPWLFLKRITSKTSTEPSQSSAAVKEDEEDRKLLEREVDELWHHVRAVKLLNATTCAKNCVHKLLTTKQKTYRGMVMMGVLAMCIPVAVALLYTSWKVDHDKTSIVAASLAVVFLAAWSSISCSQRAWTTFSKGDLSLKSLQIRSKPTETLSEEDRVQALEWLHSMAKGSTHQTALVWLALVFKIVVHVVTALMFSVSFAWLLQTSYSASSALGSAWKYTLGLILVGVVLGVAFEVNVAAQGNIVSKVQETVFLRTFVARLDVQDERITAKSLLEDSTHIAMYTMSLVEPQNVGWVATCSLAILTSLSIDPWFTFATLLATPASLVSYGLQMKRDKGLYRRLLNTAWLLGAAESLLRAVIHCTPRIVAILMAYIQIKWIANGSSSLFSVLSVEWLSFVGFSVSHTNRFALGAFIHDEAVSAASRLRKFLDRAGQLTRAEVIDPDQQGSSTRLTGDMQIEMTDRAIVIPCVRNGQVVVVVSEDTDALRSIPLSLLGESTSASAVIGEVAMTDLPLSAVRNRVMVIDADPVRLPGTLWDNIQVGDQTASQMDVEEAARCAGFVSSDLRNELTLANWVAREDVDNLKQRVITARVLLRKPDLLIVEDLSSSNEFRVDLILVAAAIRKEIPLCKVLVLRNDSAGSDWAKIVDQDH